MTDDLLKLKYNKLLSELKFVEDDLKYHETSFKQEMHTFSEEFNKKIKEMGVADKFRAPNEKRDQPKQNKKKETRAASKDLFKKIATVTHPDKLLNATEPEREIKEKKFLEASKAAEEDKIFSLHNIAKEVGIELPEISEIHILLFEDEVLLNKQKIENLKKTWAWAWLKAPGEEARALIMSKYIDFLLTNHPV
tara:strand:+ start:759 stop:1340 length:582 start_codon:yes stop_codon:yes gene_type:complete